MPSPSISIKTVRKNSGEEQSFSIRKLEKSVVLAGKDTQAYTRKEAEKLLEKIRQTLSKWKSDVITTQELRDIVEPAMAKAGYFQTAKYYILFKERKDRKREEEVQIIEPELNPVALEVMKKRYLRQDMDGKVLETPGEMFWRVAQHMAKAEINWSGADTADEMARAFYERMVNWKFVCAGKAMFEAGNPGGTGQLSSCFVLPIEDNIGMIFKTLGDAAVVHKNNGGTGFNFSKIRPQGDKVKNVPGAATGPVGFLKAFSAALAQILQGAKRQGANIAILNADHPDIYEYIYLKDEDGTIKNFNISVGVTDAFMEAVEKDKMWSLVNPRNGEVVKKVKARKLFDTIVEHAWISGDPGLAFLDRMEEDNPTPSIGPLNATNPCGEIPLLPYESCNLTSICLQNHLKAVGEKDGQTQYEIDWEDLEKSVRLGIRFLDNMIEVNTYALKEIEDMVKHGNRRIGLGVMGFGHMLYMMQIPYNSKEATRMADRLAKFIHQTAESESIELAKVRGTFPNFDISRYAGTAERYRNCAMTMIAPTGTISLIADTTSGIEPVFSLVTLRRAFNEDDRNNRPTREFMMVDAVFEKELKKLNLKDLKSANEGRKFKDWDDVLATVAESGLHEIEGLPRWFYKVFVSTHEIEPEWHVRIQAAWQRWFDNSISKTCNFPHDATVEDVKEVYMMAWKMGCKGITIYRDGSKQDQVLNTAKKSAVRSQESEEKKEEVIEVPVYANGNGKANGHLNGNGLHVVAADKEAEETSHVVLHATKPSSGESEMCPECGAAGIYADGCFSCAQCGFSKCSL